MDNPAQVFSDDVEPAQKGPTQKARIGWLRFILQAVTVVVVYLVGTMLPALPGLIAEIMEGSQPSQPGSAISALTVIVGMASALAIAWIWLRGEGRVREAFNLSPPNNWRSTLGWALVALVGTLVIFSAGGALVQALGLPAPDAGMVLEMVTQSPALFVLWLVGVAWLAAGFGEELLWRGFLMDRLERLGGLRGHIWLVLIIQAVMFGLPHAYQGWGGVIVTGMVGLLMGWVRIMQKGNLWAVIIAHAAVDTIAMSMAYGEKLGWLG